ncbi:hypothetical protein MCEREM21A_02689 [Sphingomonadaceae bacterium]
MSLTLALALASATSSANAIPVDFQGRWYPAKVNCAAATAAGSILIHEDSIVDAASEPETAQFQYLVIEVRPVSKRKIDVHSSYMEVGSEEGLNAVGSYLKLGKKGRSLSIKTYEEDDSRYLQQPRANYKRCV